MVFELTSIVYKYHEKTLLAQLSKLVWKEFLKNYKFT